MRCYKSNNKRNEIDIREVWIHDKTSKVVKKNGDTRKPMQSLSYFNSTNVEG